MADFPSYARFDLGGFTEGEDPSVLRTETERGVPKERLINTNVMATLKGNVVFLAKEDIAAFDDWYFDTIKRIGWFNMRHPRTREMLNVRLVGGKRGELQPIKAGFGIAQRAIEVEYLR